MINFVQNVIKLANWKNLRQNFCLLISNLIFFSSIYLFAAENLAPTSLNSKEVERVPQIVKGISNAFSSIQAEDHIYFIAGGDGKYIEESLKYLPKHLTIYIIDMSEAMLEKARQKLIRYQQDGRKIYFIQGDVHHLTELFDSFQLPLADGVFSFDAFNNFEQPERALKELVSILKPGKILAFNFAASIFQQPKSYFEFVKSAKRFEKESVEKGNLIPPGSPGRKFYSMVNEQFLLSSLEAGFNVTFYPSTISMTLEELLSMFEEEPDYLKRFFTLTPESTIFELWSQFRDYALSHFPVMMERIWINFFVYRGKADNIQLAQENLLIAA